MVDGYTTMFNTMLYNVYHSLQLFKALQGVSTQTRIQWLRQAANTSLQSTFDQLMRERGLASVKAFISGKLEQTWDTAQENYPAKLTDENLISSQVNARLSKGVKLDSHQRRCERRVRF